MSTTLKSEHTGSGGENDSSPAGAAPIASNSSTPSATEGSGAVDMGTTEQARHALITKTAAYRAFRQPIMSTAKELKKRETQEREALFQLGQAALLWLWHEENTMRSSITSAPATAAAASAMLAALVQHRAACHVENYFGLPDPAAAQAADMADALRMRDAAIVVAKAAGIKSEG